MRLLIHKSVYDRNQVALSVLNEQLEVVIMGEGGSIELDGKEISPEAAQPEIVFASADVFFTQMSKRFISATLQSRVLKWVQTGSAGLDDPVFRQVVQLGATLTTSHGQAIGMADYVIWAVLDVFQNGPGKRASQTNRIWQRCPAREIHGTRWLVIGFGAVGQGVGRRVRAAGGHVIGVRRNQSTHPDANEIIQLSSMSQVLVDADVVVLAIPANNQTVRLANAPFFQAMKPGCIFVNIGRGSLVEESSLLIALNKGIPEHAVLDVFDTEPLPPDNALWSHPRVTVTAHCSGLSRGNPSRNDAFFFDNLRRYFAGDALLNEADPIEALAGSYWK